MIAAAFTSFRAAFGKYSGLFTLAGFAMIIVFSAKYIQLHTTLSQTSIESAMPARVTQVSETTCTHSLNTTIQSFNVQQRCLEVHVITSSAPEGRVARRILVEQSNVGDLEIGDRVFVVAARTGVDTFFIVNAQDEFRLLRAALRTAGVCAAGGAGGAGVVPAQALGGTGGGDGPGLKACNFYRLNVQLTGRYAAWN